MTSDEFVKLLKLNQIHLLTLTSCTNRTYAVDTKCRICLRQQSDPSYPTGDNLEGQYKRQHPILYETH